MVVLEMYGLKKPFNLKSTPHNNDFSKKIDYVPDFFKRFSELIFYTGRNISFFTDSDIHYLNTSVDHKHCAA